MFFLNIVTGKPKGDNRFKVRDKVTFHSNHHFSYIKGGTEARGIQKQDHEANIWAQKG